MAAPAHDKNGILLLLLLLLFLFSKKDSGGGGVAVPGGSLGAIEVSQSPGALMGTHMVAKTRSGITFVDVSYTGLTTRGGVGIAWTYWIETWLAYSSNGALVAPVQTLPASFSDNGVSVTKRATFSLPANASLGMVDAIANLWTLASDANGNPTGSAFPLFGTTHAHAINILA